MPVTVTGGALQGVNAIPIEVEVDLLRRLPSVSIVGLAASAVKESAERVRSALQSSDERFPRKRVVINLMPADVRKEGTALDLPVALAILAADDELPRDAVNQIVAAGELSLSGDLRPVRGALSLAVLARDLGKTLVLPRENAEAAALVPNVKVVAADNLREVIQWLRGERTPADIEISAIPEQKHRLDLADVRGQRMARYALEVAAAGAHHLLLMGPPGCGKSMLAQRLPGILPNLSFEDSLEVTRVHSAAGLLNNGPLIRHRPFRAPHHTVTVAGLVGDRTLRPGEISLSHHGVLFLDEAPEFSRGALEVLRQPLEDGVVQLTRAMGTVVYPAAVTLVLAANPCPCGYAGSAQPCRCSDTQIHRYLQRLSGPILDRVDLRVCLQAVPPEVMLGDHPEENSSTVRARVQAARDRQAHRGQRCPNAQLTAGELEQYAPLTQSAKRLLMGREGAPPPS
ncbi:MAG: YifB family Mg chelatase-like AAA ATPase, partial [Rhodobacterales bacterium]|nr:YifB family Mg chelatase-like AAA ATPase [Rhodobacterales bacterium]